MSVYPVAYVPMEKLRSMTVHEIASLIRYTEHPWYVFTDEYGLPQHVSIIDAYTSYDVAYDIIQGLGDRPEDFKESILSEEEKTLSDSELLNQVYREVRKAKYWLNMTDLLYDTRAVITKDTVDIKSTKWLGQYCNLIDWASSRLQL